MPLGLVNNICVYYPRQTLLTVPDAGHSPHLERPNVFAGDCSNQFVDQCVSQPENTIKKYLPIG